MKTMTFENVQSEVTAYPLPDGGYDIIICMNGRQMERQNEPEEKTVTEWEYDGNIFRTYKLSPEEIKADPASYIDYTGDEPPTADMFAYANEAIDNYTMQLLQEGVLS